MRRSNSINVYQLASENMSFLLFLSPLAVYHKEMCLYKQGAEMRLVGMFFRVYVRSGDPTTPVCSWRKTEVFFSETKKNCLDLMQL